MAALARGAVCLSPQEVSAANSAFLSGTLQRAVKAVFAQYVVELALALKLRQGVVATAVVRDRSRAACRCACAPLTRATTRRTCGGFMRGAASRRTIRGTWRPPACFLRRRYALVVPRCCRRARTPR